VVAGIGDSVGGTLEVGFRTRVTGLRLKVQCFAVV